MSALHAPDRRDVRGPLVFLAGPISWEPTAWHDRAIALFGELAPHVTVASPRRSIEESRQLWSQREDGKPGDFPEAAYNEQMDWETHYLRQAAAHGAVMFWLAREDVHRCERPHAQTTRFELAEWKERAARDGAKLVIGIEEGFTGARYIRRRFAQDVPHVPVCDSLEATVRAALALC
jgi:hypothetical protein